jgi:hypothetical protein
MIWNGAAAAVAESVCTGDMKTTLNIDDTIMADLKREPAR